MTAAATLTTPTPSAIQSLVPKNDSATGAGVGAAVSVVVLGGGMGGVVIVGVAEVSDFGGGERLTQARLSSGSTCSVDQVIDLARWSREAARTSSAGGGCGAQTERVRAAVVDGRGRKLQRITRTAKNPVRMRRAIVVQMSAQGRTVRDITSLLQVSDDDMRDVIQAFNERGGSTRWTQTERGRPKKIGEQVRAWICAIARTSPADWGIIAFSAWSSAKLCEHLLAEGIVAELSRETLRRILHVGGVPWPTTTTWKASAAPEFIPKMRRVLDLYDHPSDDGQVVCVDGFGPPTCSRARAKPGGPNVSRGCGPPTPDYAKGLLPEV